jgi:hypothetical protein
MWPPYFGMNLKWNLCRRCDGTAEVLRNESLLTSFAEGDSTSEFDFGVLAEGIGFRLYPGGGWPGGGGLRLSAIM